VERENQAQKSTQPSTMNGQMMAARAKPPLRLLACELPPEIVPEHGESGDSAPRG